jgi:hypothetical protein
MDCKELEKDELTKVYINKCSVCLDEEVNEYIVSICDHMICINCITEYKNIVMYVIIVELI